MASKFQQEALKIVVAQICQIIGFQGIYSAPLDVLIDLLHRYLKEIAVTTHRYCEHYGRTEPNIDDLGQAFQEMGISISDLEEYVSYVEPIGFPHKTPKLPVPKSSDLNFLKPGARENLSRPLHVHEHLPPMQPDKEDEEVNLSNHLEEEASGSEAPEESPASPSQGKRSSEAEVSPSKKLRPCPEEEGEPVREIDSVMMTTSGYISSAREGKMPEPRRPTIPMAHPRSGSPTAGGPAKLIKKKVTMEKIIWNKNHKTGILPGPLAKPKGKHLKLKPKIPLAPPGTGSLKHMRSPSRGQAPKLKIPNLTKKEEPKDGGAVTKETPPVVFSPPKKSVIPTPAPPPVEKEGGGEKKRKKDREAERRRRREKEREERKEARREAAAEGMTPSAFRKERTRIRLRGLSKEEELRRYKERENELIAALAASSAVTITSIPPTSLRVREKTPERSPPPPVSAPGGGGVGGPPCPPLTPSPAKSKLSVFKKLPKGGREGGERDSSPDLMIDDMMVKEEKPSPPPSPRDEFPIMFREEAAFSGVGTAPPNPDVHLPLLMPKAIKKEKEPQKRQKPQKPQKSPKPQKLPKPPKLPKTPKPPKSPKSQKPQKPPKPKKERVKKKSPKEKGTHGVKKGGSVTTFNPTWRNPAKEQLSPDRPKTPEAGQNPIPGDIGTPPLFTISPFRHGPSLIPPPFSRFPFIPPFGAPPRPPLPDINPISHMFLGGPPLVDQKGFETMESGDRPPTPSLDLAVRALTPPPLSLKEHRSPVPPMDKSPPPLSHPTKKAPENPIGLQTVRGEKPDKKEKKEHKKERKKKEEEKEEKEKKKEEKEKEKLKKKKDKRDKEKAKEEKKKEKKEEKERLKKEKKEKKEKKGAAAASTVATTAAASSSTTATTPAVSSLESVPKLTLKFQAENGDTDTKTSDTKVTPKLVIKPVVKRPSDELPVQIQPPEKKRKKNTPSPSPPSPLGPPRVLHQEGPCSPPEIAKFSALVMRPPKGSQTKKGSETLTVPPLKIKDSSMKASSKKEIGSIVGGTKAELKESTVPPLKIKNSLPQISVPPKPAPEPKQTSASRKSEKKERKKKNAPLIITSLAGVAVEPINSPPPMVSPPAQLPPPIPIPSEMPSSKSSKKSSGGAGFSASSGASSSKASSGLLTETVGPIGHFVDDQGNEVWICPTCGKQDDGSPMIGCDTCDDWYHWICVGIHVPPSERENWYCPRCLSQHKQQQRGTMGVEKKKRGRKKKNP